MKHFFSLLLLFVATVSLSAQTVSNVQANFNCPGGVEVTYDLAAGNPADATLYYSPDNGKTWLEAKTVTKTGTTIVWDNRADNVKFGQFKLKVDVPKEPECVEIAGVCWATRNVDTPGTFAQNPENFGMFYQWNRNVGWSSTNPMVNSNGGTTWDGSNPSRTWNTANDPCPVGFRVPTEPELVSLLNSGSTWTTDWNGTGVEGSIFGSGANTIFFPAAGYRNSVGGSYTYYPTCYYWSTRYWGSGARYLSVGSFFERINDMSDLRTAYSVRCVKE